MVSAATAERDELDLLADLLLSDSTPVHRQTVLALSVCIAVTPDDLSDIVIDTWDNDKSSVELAIQDLAYAPLIERTAAGLRINTAISPRLAERFRRDDTDAFRHVHQVLADRENSVIQGLEEATERTDDVETWFALGRHAFYLAGVQASDSVDEFGRAFESAPQSELQAARLWLSTLVARQATLLSEHTRALDFFRGFRAYVEGRKRVAYRSFTSVIHLEKDDQYRAISLHLRALCTNSGPARRKDLSSSVRLSENLNLAENGIMARNSLATAFLVEAQRLAKTGNLSETNANLRRGLVVAIKNVEAARPMRDRSYLVYTLGMHATILWSLYAGTDYRNATSEPAQAALPQVLQGFRSTIEIADNTGLNNASLISRNRLAGVLRDVKRIGDALEQIQLATNRVSLFSDPQTIVKLSKTARSLQADCPPHLMFQLRRALDRLQDWLRRLS